MYLDQWTIDQIFNRIDTLDGDLLYWAPTREGDAYIVLWPRGHEYAEHLHTYRYPPDIWG
jgi:hypothetical protein